MMTLAPRIPRVRIAATAAPAHCPVCRHPQGYFVRVELAPYHSGPVK